MHHVLRGEEFPFNASTIPHLLIFKVLRSWKFFIYICYAHLNQGAAQTNMLLWPDAAKACIRVVSVIKASIRVLGVIESCIRKLGSIE